MSAIKVGDLVVVVADCCGKDTGLIFRVSSIEGAQLFECCDCHTMRRATGVAERSDNRGVDTDGIEYGWYPLNWLKRIPPLDELERDQIVKEITCQIGS